MTILISISIPESFLVWYSFCNFSLVYTFLNLLLSSILVNSGLDRGVFVDLRSEKLIETLGKRESYLTPLFV